MKTYILFTALAGTAAFPAMAQSDSPFTGPRVEVFGGFDSLSSGSDVDNDAGDDEIFDDDGPDESVEGFLYGAAIGYDFDVGAVIFGIEGEFSDSTGEQESDEMINAPFGYDINMTRDLYVGGRIGAQVGPSTLLYAKGGYTNAHVESRFEDMAEDDGFDFDLDTGQTLDGYRIGAGVEQLIGEGLMGVGSSGFVKLEYRYSNYGELSYDDQIFQDAASEVDIDLDRHQILAGVGIRF